MRDRSFPPHRWEANPTSRNKNLPCGRCGIYQYLHDQMYGAITLRELDLAPREDTR